MKIKIADFRKSIDSLNWSRNDLSGATANELLRIDVNRRLTRIIDELSPMIPHVSNRFADDIEEAKKAIFRAETCIQNWQAKVLQQPKNLLTIDGVLCGVQASHRDYANVFVKIDGVCHYHVLKFADGEVQPSPSNRKGAGFEFVKTHYAPLKTFAISLI